MKPARILALLLTAVLPATAQYTAKKIIFTDPGPYTQSQLETVAGIHVGTQFNADSLGAAAQRLVDSGYFDLVSSSVEGMINAVSVTFVLKPSDHAEMLHVGFENFVWLTPAEIEDAVHAKSPLFAGYLTENSPIEEVVNTALTEALAAKGITAVVTHETIEPTMLHPERVLQFRVSKPSVLVTNVKLLGVTPELVPLIQKSVNAIARTALNEGLGGETTQDRLLAPLRDAGYIQASLSNVARTPSDVANDTVSVVLSATLSAGDIFHVSGITFAGTPLLSAESFAASQTLHAGDVAARQELLKTVAPLDAAYRSQGYMDVVAKVTPAVEAPTHQVAYAVTVVPGEQYRIREITTNNLDAAGRADFDRGFLMKAGELYNPEYVTTFLKKNATLQALAGYSASFKAYADPNAHTVDLVITFFRGATR